MSSDLTKLTAEEFCRRVCDINHEDYLEIRRRLERLEQCEAALRGILEAMKDAQQANAEAYSEFLCEIAELVPEALMAARAALEETK